MIRAKLSTPAVTALLMVLCLTTTESAEAAVPLELSIGDGVGCPVSLSRLSQLAGLSLRRPGVDRSSWRATVAKGAVSLRRPDGTVAATKRLPHPRVSCEAVDELLAILLAAHVPQVVLAPLALAPLAKKVSEPRPNPASVAWRASLGGGIGSLTEGAGPLLALSGIARVWRGLAAGARLALSHRGEALEGTGGEVAVLAFDAQSMVGYLAHKGRLSWSAGALAGLRVSHGSASGLAASTSDSVPSLTLGLYLDHWWRIARRLTVGAAAVVAWALPRAGFSVTNWGQAYHAPAPTVDLYLTIGWGS